MEVLMKTYQRGTRHGGDSCDSSTVTWSQMGQEVKVGLSTWWAEVSLGPHETLLQVEKQTNKKPKGPRKIPFVAAVLRYWCNPQIC